MWRRSLGVQNGPKPARRPKMAPMWRRSYRKLGPQKSHFFGSEGLRPHFPMWRRSFRVKKAPKPPRTPKIINFPYFSIKIRVFFNFLDFFKKRPFFGELFFPIFYDFLINFFIIYKLYKHKKTHKFL